MSVFDENYEDGELSLSKKKLAKQKTDSDSKSEFWVHPPQIDVSIAGDGSLLDGYTFSSSTTSAPVPSNVDHPFHYNSSKYECIEVMRDIFGDEAVRTWIKLNLFKYAWRADRKNHDEDIAKIAWYADYYGRMTKGNAE